MSPSELIASAAVDGVRLHRIPATDELRVSGEKKGVNRWLAQISAQESEVISLLMEREERAAIHEFDGKLSRREAERKAGLPSSEY